MVKQPEFDGFESGMCYPLGHEFSQEIVVTADFYAIRVNIGGVLHTHIIRSKLLAVNSWTDHDHSFSIEYAMAGGSMVTEYTERSRWLTILRQLEGLL